MDAPLLVERSGGVVTVTLNRPEAMNSFDERLHREFPRLLEELDDDPEARASRSVAGSSGRPAVSSRR